MKLRTKFSTGLLALAALCAVLFLTTRNRAQRELEATRRLLHRQGFKVELREFNLATTPEEARRAAILVTTTRAALTNGIRPRLSLRELPRLLTPAGPDSALVVWRNPLATYRSPDLWQEMRQFFASNPERLDDIRQAAISGPLRFEPIGSQTPLPLLPYLAELKELALVCGWQSMLALHDGKLDPAWTNLLAATCLATAYTPEPIELSHLVRIACASIVSDFTWNALQSKDWTEAQLAELQRRWEAVDFWSGLPETAAYARAEAAATCEMQRRESHASTLHLNQTMRNPKATWYYVRFYLSRLRYFHQGSYEDEKALLLYYRDRELEISNSVKAATWADMCSLPGVTNLNSPLLKPGSTIQPFLNLRSVGMAFQRGGQSMLSRTAEAEARRRLLITALALEQFHKRHGSYPQQLKQLVPVQLKAVPADFMDGHPLRYRLAGEQYVLYSVGLDCVDNGGKMPQPRDSRIPSNYEPFIAPASQQGTDLVWPRAASPAEAERWRQQEQQTATQQQQRDDEVATFERWSQADARQAQVETILASHPQPMTNEPTYNHRPLAAVLANPKTTATNQLKLTDLLALKQVLVGRTVLSPPPPPPGLTDTEPEIVTFELPISYDALTNLSGELTLLVDPVIDPNSDDDCEAQQMECLRGTNGNCRLVWNTIYESPGKHALQVALSVDGIENAEEPLLGPIVPFVVSNLCQFSISSATFQPGIGPTFRARFVETNAAYSIEIRSPNGGHVKSIKGSSSDGFMKVRWDLKDDVGNPCTGDAYNTTLHITLPGSGRTQALRGP